MIEKEFVAKKWEFQYLLKVVAQEDLPGWVHPEYCLKKKLKLVQEWVEHHHEQEPTTHLE